MSFGDCPFTDYILYVVVTALLFCRSFRVLQCIQEIPYDSLLVKIYFSDFFPEMSTFGPTIM